MLGRIRFLPLTLVAAALLLGLKVGAFWQGTAGPWIGDALAKSDAVAPAGAKAGGKPVELKPPAGEAPRPALAEAKAEPPAGAERAAPPASPPPRAEAAPAPRDPTDLTRGEIELLENLSKRREALEARARELDMREKLLAAAEQRIETRIAELKKLEGQVQALIKRHDDEEEKNLRSLVKVYENMKPRDAARIFEQLDMQVLLGVVERMKEAKLAPVLAQMDPARAQRLTVDLATRRQLPAVAAPVAGKSGNG
jgi:flagellar motility protein MotE (MotC chaperone)